MQILHCEADCNNYDTHFWQSNYRAFYIVACCLHASLYVYVFLENYGASLHVAIGA